MPRKLRQLRADLAHAGFALDTKRGKGSHTYWEHPKLPHYSVNLSGGDGEDAKPYQEKLVREARAKAQGVK